MHCVRMGVCIWGYDGVHFVKSDVDFINNDGCAKNKIVERSEGMHICGGQGILEGTGKMYVTTSSSDD